MRKVTFGGANSLDNYFARKDESVDWLLWCKEVEEMMKDYWKNIDTVVMGRRTYEFATRNGGGIGTGTGVKTYVFSRTIKKWSSKKLTFVSEDAADYVRRLKKEEKGKDICIMGGGLLAKSLFEINEVSAAIEWLRGCQLQREAYVITYRNFLMTSS